MSLYGSRARMDHTEQSDIDILLVTDDERFRHKIEGSLSLSYYPINDLIEKAENGDLFLYHVLHEGKFLFDPGRLFELLRKKFKLKSDYSCLIQDAGAVAWMIVNFWKVLETSPILHRRITWCVRSILIALSANIGEPAFTLPSLEKYSPQSNLKLLFSQKEQIQVKRKVITELERFLMEQGILNPLPGVCTISCFKNYFEKKDISIGVGLINSVKNRHSLVGYA